MMNKLKRGDLVYLCGKTYEMQLSKRHNGRHLVGRDVESHAIYLGLLTPDDTAGSWDDMEQYYNFYEQSTGKIIQIGHHNEREGENPTGSWKDLIYAMNHGVHHVDITLPDGTVH